MKKYTTFVENEKGKQKKISIFRYKPNKRSTRVKKGHRQPYTKVEIKKIK